MAARDFDAFDNPVSSGDEASAKVDAVLATFDTEEQKKTFDVEDSAGKRTSSKNDYSLGHKKTGALCSCCCGRGTVEIQQKASVIEFDPIEVPDSIHPTLIDHTGFELPLERESSLVVTSADIADVAQDDEDDAGDEIRSHLAELEAQLQGLHEQIRKTEDTSLEDFDTRRLQVKGNALRNHEVNQLYSAADKVEEQIEAEQRRVNEEEELRHKEATAAAKARSAAAPRSAALDRFRKAGRKAIMGLHAVNAVAAAVTHVTIDDPELSLGLDWHFQGGKAVCAAVRDGGSGHKYMGGKVLRPGMVLKEYDFGSDRSKTVVTFARIQEEIRKYKDAFPDSSLTPGHCLAMMLDKSRPMSLHFYAPGEDFREDEKAEGKKVSLDESKTGFALQDLKYLAPKTNKNLGAFFWKTRHGVVLCDIENDSIMSQDDFLLEGARPGLVLKSIISADGFTREMSNADLTYTQIMRQVAISQRPCVYVFASKPEPFEFTFDQRAVMKPTKQMKKAVRARSKDATGQPFAYSIFRELGLSLREEETSGWGGHNWRCRVSAILPGGLIDRFNHMHEHPWVTPGMTIATVYSPMRAVTDVRGMSLAEVTDLFHRCAPGHEVVKEHTNSSGRIKRTTYGPLHNRSVAHPFLLAAFRSKFIGEQ